MTVREALQRACEHHAKGELADAAGIYRLILTLHPDCAPALNNLGMMSPPDEAVDLFRRAVAAEPAYLDAIFNLATSLQARGAWDEIIAVCKRALPLVASDVNLHFCLGHALQSAGQTTEAAAQYAAALAINPDFVPALCNLGTLCTVAECNEQSVVLYTRALAIDPDLVVANMNMVGILEAEGRLADAQRLRDRVPCPREPVIETAPDPQYTVLVLSSSKGNVPVDALLPREATTRITLNLEYATDAQEAALPAYDLVFNAIGNADTMAASYDRAARFHARRAVLNPPHIVARTRRDRMPRLLQDIPDVVVPAVIRVERAELAKPGVAARLAAKGIHCPVLVRPIVGHGGNGIVLAHTPDQLEGLTLIADAYYVIAYHDYRSADGYYRKYRSIFVDRQVYPYHLAISKHWLVHYFSADMMSEPWKRVEEQRFLEDEAAALGPKAVAALAAIARRMDLDFAGIDFTVLPDGRVLVFEANATMLVHLNDSAEDFPYKHTAVPRITDAFNAMLDRHASRVPHQRVASAAYPNCAEIRTDLLTGPCTSPTRTVTVLLNT